MSKYNKLLILDIDETLIHSSEKLLERQADFQIDKYFVYTRPGLYKFILTCSDWFSLAIWTSASSDYAHEIISHIFPSELKLEFVFTRERCLFKRNPDLDSIQIFKPLKKVRRKGFTLDNVLIIDDTAETFAYNYGNAILVNKYQGEENDIELFLLLKYLEIIGIEKNVRILDKRHWRCKVDS